jgi:hypothetical protein
LSGFVHSGVVGPACDFEAAGVCEAGLDAVGVAAEDGGGGICVEVVETIGIVDQGDGGLACGNAGKGFFGVKILDPVVAEAGEPEALAVDFDGGGFIS